jgi:lysophosphatidate acyltransferase
MLVPFLVLGALLMPALILSPNRILPIVAPIMPALALAPFSPRMRYWLRLTAYVAGLGLTSIWGVVVAVAMSIAGQRQNVNFVVARSFYRFVGPLVGIRFRVEGAEHLDSTRPCVIVGNHQVCASFPRQ